MDAIQKQFLLSGFDLPFSVKIGNNLKLYHNEKEYIEVYENGVNLKQFDCVDYVKLISEGVSLSFVRTKKIPNMESLNSVGLEKLEIQSGKISHTKNIGKLKNLKSLDLAFNSIKTLEYISSLSNLEDLIVRNNPISNFSECLPLLNLKSLDLTGTRIKDLDYLTSLPKLKYLSIPYSKNLDINSLSSLHDLKTLVISDLNSDLDSNSRAIRSQIQVCLPRCTLCII